MPYTIKATYYGMTRKLRPFHPAGLPSWDELQREIIAVFWRVESFGVANVQLVDRFIAEPISLNDGGLIAGSLDWDTQVRCAAEARDDLSAGVVLKFDIFDIPKEEPAVKQEAPASKAVHDAYWTQGTSAATVAESVRSATPTQKTESCCSVHSAKRDVAELLKKFTTDFENLTIDFRTSAAEEAQNAQDEAATGSVPKPKKSLARVICDGCDTEITDKRYKCETCANFDFCEECYNMNKTRFGTYGHPHQFGLASLDMGATWSAPAAEAVAPPQSGWDEGSRHNAFCNSCFRNIRGVRHKCTDCPDYDLCGSCILQHTVVHQPEHQFVTINEPGEVIMWDPSHSQSDNSELPDIIRAFPDAAPEGSEFTLHAATCDGCGAGIAGIRYKCLDCPDYDLCSGCLSNRKELHQPAHHFLIIDRPTNIIKHVVPEPRREGHRCGRPARAHARRRAAAAAAFPEETIPRPTAVPQFSAEVPSVPSSNPVAEPIHPATCDLCSSKIIGVRYKCVDCPDYDTCQSCFAITEEQHPEHSFIRISNPADYIHRSAGSIRRMPSHHARCNACNHRISSAGPRYKCTHPACPDFDLCPSCEALPHPVHPLEHVMLKLRVPASMIEPREVLAHEPREASVEHPAQCDHCGSKIVGIRYKCAECDDFDLCQACESLPTSHNRAHVLMKIKVPMYTRTREELRSPRPATTNNPFVSPEDTAIATPAVPSTPQPSEIAEQPVMKNMTQRSAASLFIESLLNAGPVPVSTTPPVVDTEAKVLSPTEDASELHGIFLEDLSIPDGHPLPPNSHFIKRWRLLNPGPQAWPANTELRFTGGDAMGASEVVTVGPVHVGEEKVVSVEMQAGTTEGKQVGFWSLGQAGQLFGHRLWVEIEVINIMNASMQASTLAGSGSGSSMDSSVVVMPAAPSVAGSAAEAEGPAPVSPLFEVAPATEPQVDSDIEESSHAMSSNVSLVSLSEAGSDDEDWNDANLASGEPAGVRVPEMDDGWADVADALERDASRANPDLEADAEDATLRDRSGYVLVYDETDEE